MKRAVLCVLLALWPGLASGSALMIGVGGFEPTDRDFPLCAPAAPTPSQRKVKDLGLIDIVQLQPRGYCVVLRDANGPVQAIMLAKHDFTGGLSATSSERMGMFSLPSTSAPAGSIMWRSRCKRANWS